MPEQKSCQWIIAASPSIDAREFERFLVESAFPATERASLTRVTRGIAQSLSSAESPDGGSFFLWGVSLDLMNDSASSRIVSDVEGAMQTALEPHGATLSSSLTPRTPTPAATA